MAEPSSPFGTWNGVEAWQFVDGVRLHAIGGDQILLAVQALEKRAGVLERTVEINRLENEADRAHQRAVGLLFEEERDPIAVMKWKEILDVLEDATDRCEDVANLLENVVVKHG